MKLLGLDVGSSSVKAGVVQNGRVVSKLYRGEYASHYDGARAEVEPGDLLRAISQAIAQLGKIAKKVDAVALAVMSPAWIALDKKGKPLTRIITHQDRRSVEQARKLLKRLSSKKWLEIAGNLPFPGSISATTVAWFLQHEPAVIKRAHLIGHLNTFLIHQLTGERAIDPANASFTGLYETVRQGTWSEQLCDVVGVSRDKLPEILSSDTIAGQITADAARKFGLAAGTPVLTGMIDTSAAMLLTGAKPGQLLNVSGSTDVLALCAAKPHPRENLLTRALGVGRLWMMVDTLAAGGASFTWMHQQFFREMSEKDFFSLVRRVAKRSGDTKGASRVAFEPYLAGQRASIEQKSAEFTGLSLATTREEMLRAVTDAIAAGSARRLRTFRATGSRLHRKVVVSGGAAQHLHQVIYRDWGNGWSFRTENEATLRGLSMLSPKRR